LSRTQFFDENKNEFEMDSFLRVIHGPMKLFFEKSGSCVKKAVSENGKICEHNVFNEKNSKENQVKYNG